MVLLVERALGVIGQDIANGSVLGLWMLDLESVVCACNRHIDNTWNPLRLRS